MKHRSRSFTRGFALLAKSAEKTFASRLMLPGDANIAGNVHGGTILHMIDQAASIAAIRHCNSVDHVVEHVALARIDKMEFKAPVFIGNVAEVQAQVTFVSIRSLEVDVAVFSEDLRSSDPDPRLLTNKATCWYVPVEKINKGVLVLSESVRPLKYDTELDSIAGQKRYESQKLNRKAYKDLFNNELDKPILQTKLASWILPDECFQAGNAQGGVIMKLMDSSAALFAFEHCKSNAVTVSLEALDFVSPIVLGDFVEVKGRLVYTSNKVMDIKIEVHRTNVYSGESRLCVTSNLVFVALDDKGKVRPIEQLDFASLSTAWEINEYKLAEKRHQRRTKK